MFGGLCIVVVLILDEFLGLAFNPHLVVGEELGVHGFDRFVCALLVRVLAQI